MLKKPFGRSSVKSSGKNITRRQFLTTGVGAGAATLIVQPGAGEAETSKSGESGGWRAKLIDITQCIGCRKCEAACATANELPATQPPVEDTAVFKIERRPTDKAFTVINRYPTDDKDKPAYVKVQCMHCVDPACVSACIVGALTKDEATGAVVYDAGRCLGCRYCMVACPYQIPAYEYGEALKPRVRKCELCNSRITPEKPVPACVKSCPREAILFGRRDEILETARMRISRSPGRYVDKVYGETEVGGADVMYLAPVDFSRLGLLKLPDAAPPRLTEAIQHGVFRYFIPPAALFAFLGTMMHVFRDRDGGGGRK